MSDSKVSKEEFEKLVKDHDWFYSMSEDPRWWKQGKNEEELIMRLIKDNEDFTKIFEEEKNRMFPKI